MAALSPFWLAGPRDSRASHLPARDPTCKRRKRSCQESGVDRTGRRLASGCASVFPRGSPRQTHRLKAGVWGSPL